MRQVSALLRYSTTQQSLPMSKAIAVPAGAFDGNYVEINVPRQG